jgi:hypothetical protein
MRLASGAGRVRVSCSFQDPVSLSAPPCPASTQGAGWSDTADHPANGEPIVRRAAPERIDTSTLLTFAYAAPQ